MESLVQSPYSQWLIGSICGRVLNQKAKTVQLEIVDRI